jgi:hypothetical protein
MKTSTSCVTLSENELMNVNGGWWRGGDPGKPMTKAEENQSLKRFRKQNIAQCSALSGADRSWCFDGIRAHDQDLRHLKASGLQTFGNWAPSQSMTNKLPR